MPEANVRKTSKWTDDEAKDAVNKYNELVGSGVTSPEAVEKIADELNRTNRSVQGKLTSLKVYVAPEKKPAAKKDEGPTKGEILTAIEKMNFNPNGFESATKPALQRLHDFVASTQEASD